MNTARKILSLVLFLLALNVVPASAQENSKRDQKETDDKVSSNAKSGEAPGKEYRGPQKIVSEGIAVEFTIDPVTPVGKAKSAELMEGEDVLVRFKISDTNTGTVMTGLKPSAWMNLRSGKEVSQPKECREKTQSFLQGSLRARPDIDLNAYYVLALNQESNISVIDPLLGFGGSKLYTLVLLKSPGEDWVLSRDGKRLFVSLPLVNQVAVVDTATWKVVANLDAGFRPTRLVLQPDEKYLWVSNEGAAFGEAEQSGVTVIDAAELRAVARIKTGAGPHDIAVTANDRYAFVTNKQDSTLSIIDVRKLTKIKDVKTGLLPVTLAIAPLSQALYVLNEGDGTITVVDLQSHEILTRLETMPGLKAIRFAPDGRWGFLSNRKENTVHLLDSSTNRIVRSITVGKNPDQISFTSTFAYIRSAGTEEVNMIRLSTVSKGEIPDITKFPGGQLPPGRPSNTSLANAIFPAPEGNSVLVANPADKMIYYYAEGMAAPMGNFQNYRRAPRAVLVVDRSLRETSPGTYAATAKFPSSGNYDVAFLLDSPRIIHCFDAVAKTNLTLKKERQVALKLESITTARLLRVGEDFRLRFRLTDTVTNQPRSGLKDVRVLTFLAPGIWQRRDWARPVGAGVYEVTLNAPGSGVYYIFFECPSLHVPYRQLPNLIFQATAAEASQKTGQDNQ